MHQLSVPHLPANRRQRVDDAGLLGDGLKLVEPVRDQLGASAIVTQAAKGKLRAEAAGKVTRFGGQKRYLWNLFTRSEQCPHEGMRQVRLLWRTFRHAAASVA